MKQCQVPKCTNPAEYEVILYDIYAGGDVFFKRDSTCSFICSDHVEENEQTFSGVREPRRSTVYRYTNQHVAQGFTIYIPIDWKPEED